MPGNKKAQDPSAIPVVAGRINRRGSERGKLKVFGGPMFAGKTTALFAAAKDLPKESFLFIKPSIDDRYKKDSVVTHDGAQMPAMLVSNTKPRFVAELPKNVKTIFIDELNFFTFDELWPQIEEVLNNGVNVVAGGLMYDFRHQPFGATLPIKEKADEFVELFARCDNCGAKATHTYRKIAGDAQIIVGAKESYGAYCLKCWTEATEPLHSEPAVAVA